MDWKGLLLDWMLISIFIIAIVTILLIIVRVINPPAIEVDCELISVIPYYCF